MHSLHATIRIKHASCNKTYGENHSIKPFDIKKGCGGISSATPSLSNVFKTLLMAEIRRQTDINE